nr:MAG TPA: hypothetical protein [Caudoviricetes sp.]
MGYILISRSFLQKTVTPLQIFQGKSAISNFTQSLHLPYCI